MKAAFFDVTGTLVHEGVLRDFILYLSKHHVLPQVTLLALLQTERMHKTHHLTELHTSQRLVRLITDGLKGYPQKKFQQIGRDFARRENKQTFPQTKPLLRLLQKDGYRCVAVSGAFEELVEPLTQTLGIDAAFGTRLDVKNGKYTGKIKFDLTNPKNKANVVQKYAKAKQIVLADSFCFGDMILDEKMMSLVGKPIALHAGPALLRVCKKRGWRHWTARQVNPRIRTLL